MRHKVEHDSRRGFLRVILAVALTVGASVAVADGSVVLAERVNGRPNLVEGGYVYYYGTANGNAPYYTEPNNVLGRIPHHVENYVPPMGQTNTIFLARGESFSVPSDYEFVGTDGYGNSPIASDAKAGYLHYFPEGDHMVFKAVYALDVNTESLQLTPGFQGGSYLGGDTVDCYFRHALPGGGYEYGCLQLVFVNRADAFYRMPRNDTYYVRTGTTLWFCDFDGKTAGLMKGSPWAKPNGEAMTANYVCDDWSFTKCTALDDVNKGYFDTFTIHAAPNTTLHLKSVDGTRDVTVHVVDANFKFTSHTLFFKYGATKDDFETRLLSTILYECQEPYTLADVESVTSVDETKGVAVRKNETSGDYALTPRDYHDFDRYVVVTLTGNRGVILLKITSFPGRCDETLCARKLPKVVYSQTFKNLIVGDNGQLVLPPTWEENCTSRNAPPGYPYIARTVACVLYRGKRYTLYVACQSPAFIASESASVENMVAGQTECVRSHRKIIAWLEDLDGYLFVSPAISIGNSGHSELLTARLSFGTANCIYTNDERLDVKYVDGDHPEKARQYYEGTVLSAQGVFQGITPDAYGYYSLQVGSSYYDDDEAGKWRDELSVFEITGQQLVTVTKHVVGGDPADRFSFEESHTIYDGGESVCVTNIFSLADGESWSFAVLTNTDVRVTEVTNKNYTANVKAFGQTMYVRTNEVATTYVTNDIFYVFRNDTTAGEANPVKLWITDHADAGPNKVHLAFQPIFDRADVSLGSWLTLAREQEAIRVVHAADELGLDEATPEPVGYRDGTGARDIMKNWVWITKDVPADDSLRLSKILISPVRSDFHPYEDDTFSCTLPANGRFSKTEIDASTSLYAFTNLDETAEIALKRPSRVKSVVLVGGGGGGGAGGNAVTSKTSVQGSGGGGGGGGGEVRRLTAEQLADSATLSAGETFWIDVGMGGAPSSFVQVPGDNGGETTLTFGNKVFRAIGGGGGGSSYSQFPGIPYYNYHGYGRSGANGGGGAYNQIGGDPSIANGFAGGSADLTAGNGVGGGGGMAAVGGNGTSSASGNGGEGLSLFVGGRTDIFGAGGGGGGRLVNGSIGKTGGLGGTHAGRGAYDVLAHAGGADGESGFGGGGGGGGDPGVNGQTGRGGRGGCGTVLIELQDASTIDAITSVLGVLPSTARLSASLVSFAPEKGHSASVYFAFAAGNNDLVFGDTPLATDVGSGDVVRHTLQSLTSDSDYRYAFKFVDDLGNVLVTSGSFHTKTPSQPGWYEDFYLTAEPGVDVQKTADDTYVVTFSNQSGLSKIIANDDLVLEEALVVGGGGGGGTWLGGGGGGGGVVRVGAMNIALGTEIRAQAGAGGDGAGNYYNLGSNGGDSRLDIPGIDSVIAHGGGGAGGWGDEWTGCDAAKGGSGGGGGGWPDRYYGARPGLGGDCYEGEGHKGGDAYHDWSNRWCPGGGGGASAAGESGYAIETYISYSAGKGGEGLSSTITGTAVVYGSGGGGGGSSSRGCRAAAGGTNAGTGGSIDGNNGSAGTDGMGGGGGGGALFGSGARGGNGTVILKLKVPGGSTPVAKAVSINEVMAKNKESLATANGGEELDWIELRNVGYQAVDVAGWKISVDGKSAEITGDTVLPANGTKVVWADKKYTDYAAGETSVKLNISNPNEGETSTIELRDASDEVVSSVTFGMQLEDVSYARTADGSWGYYSPPTPGAYNAGVAHTAPTPTVTTDVPRGYLTETRQVTLACPSSEGREIRYTMDGTSPTAESSLYTGPLTIDRTTCLKAAVVDGQSIKQNETTTTYIFLDDVLRQDATVPPGFPASGAVNGHAMVYGFQNLPAEGTDDHKRLLNGFTNSIATLSLVMDPKGLFDKTTGIYVNPSTLNEGRDWERPVHVEQIDPTNSANEFAIAAGLRLRGGDSRQAANPKHSLRLFFRDEYGGKLKFPLFGEEGASKFSKIDLRTEQNYAWSRRNTTCETFVHEVFARDTQRDTGCIYTRSRYYHLFINGQYWGLYQTQERGDEKFAETYAGGKDDDYDIIKTKNYPGEYVTEVDVGTNDAWWDLWQLAREGFSGTHADNYMKALGCNPDGSRNEAFPILLNPRNLMAFMLNTHYMVDGDSPNSAWAEAPNNLYALRCRDDAAVNEPGFFFLRHDAEHSMGSLNCDSYRRDYCRCEQDPTGWGTGNSAYGNFNPAYLHARLMANPTYKTMFADAFYRTCLKPGGALTTERALARFRARMAEIDDAIVCEAARWARNGQTRATWLAACDDCLDFISNRLPHMTRQYRERGWYPSIDAPTISITAGKAMFAGTNPVYYTLDGRDPQTDGVLAPEEGVTLPADGTTVVRARCRSNSGEWSAMDEVTVP